jgi:hypothetical protein
MNDFAPHPQNAEGLLTFPSEYTIKVIGKASADFEAIVLALVRQHVDALGEVAIRSRASRGQKYLALSITILARDRAQLDAIYRNLSASDRVLMAL